MDVEKTGAPYRDQGHDCLRCFGEERNFRGKSISLKMGLVPINTLKFVLDLPRHGNLLADAARADVDKLAARVNRVADEEYLAPSAASAAAWLVRLAHQNADLESEERYVLRHLSPRPCLLCFRGQPAKYSLLAPSLSRFELPRKRQHQRAVAWLHIALQLWANANFRFSNANNDGWWKGRPYALDRAEEVDPVAQHYGLGTNLIDWTWDPVVAACFAAHRLDVSSDVLGERTGRVYIRAIPPESKSQAMLPPSFATRIWHQRGAFQWQPDPDAVGAIAQELGSLGQLVSARQAVTSYPSVSFACSRADRDDASDRIAQLVSENDPLQLLADWSLVAAENVAEGPAKSLTFSPTLEALADALPYELLAEYHKILQSSRKAEEDLQLMIDYVDCVAIRQTSSGKQYDAAGLYLLAKAMTDRHCLCQETTDERRTVLSTLQKFMSKPEYFWSLAKNGDLGEPPLW